MTYYQHYSFDLWLTLIKSNPQFKEQRARYFHFNYNFHRKTLNEVKLIFRQVDLMANAINEKTGKNIDADELYLLVISIMNNYDILTQDIDMDELFFEMEYLLYTHLPVIYSPETSDALNLLKQKSKSTFSILSNTGFIKGELLRKVIAELNLDDLFEFQLYSDEVGLSKPNNQFFELMLQTVADMKNKKKINPKTIIHVGDNPRTDVEGANSVGINSLLINSNQQTILSLLSE